MDDSPGVSRHHARITVDDDTAVVEDLGGKNGTCVGDFEPIRDDPEFQEILRPKG